MDEILVSLKGMENSKSPGPDGLTKEFYFKIHRHQSLHQ
jgi:hypothetical protein